MGGGGNFYSALLDISWEKDATHMLILTLQGQLFIFAASSNDCICSKDTFCCSSCFIAEIGTYTNEYTKSFAVALF